MKNLKFWIGVFGFYTLIGLLNTSAVTTSILAESGRMDPFILFYEMTGAYCAFALLPLILLAIRKFPIEKHHLSIRIPLHIIFAILAGILQTLLMWGTRDVIFRIMNWGVYDYGIMTYRFLMECSKLFMAYWMVYGVVKIIDYWKEIQQRKIETSKLQEQLTSARLQALQMQLNPHFLFNTLNMISSVMYENVSKADTMLTNLSDLLRKTLDSGKQNEETLKDEIEKTKMYVQIMSARFLDKLKVEYDFPQDEQSLNILVPPFILQPLVENSIKHSQEILDQIVKIKISAQIINKNILLTIIDNGPGIQESLESNLNSGIGLKNTVERLEKLYGNNQQFLLENIQDGGLKTSIMFPANSK